MRTLRTATFMLAVMALAAGPAATVARTDSAVDAIMPVTGSLAVEWLPGGSFDVSEGVFQYRDYAVGGSTGHLSDPRLSGYVVADWSWDVDVSGDKPMPAWGTLTISTGAGSWQGTFNGVRHGDFAPVGLHALLFGTGPYEGLCATLDITSTEMAGSGTWLVDGVIHPAPMVG